MPYKLIKNPNKRTYMLINDKTKQVYAYETTPSKAKQQIMAIEISKNKKTKKKHK